MNAPHAPRSLSSQILPPARRLLPSGSIPALALALGAVTTVSLATLMGHHLASDSQPDVQLVVMNKPPPVPIVVTTAPAVVTESARPESADKPEAAKVSAAEPELPRNSNYALVFKLDGHTYVAIDTITKPDPWTDEPLPADTFPLHGTLRVIGDREYPSGVVAPVQAKDLAPDIAAWQNHPLVLDNRCEGAVADFALVGLITGSPLEYIDTFDKTSESELANGLLRYGNALIVGRVPECSLGSGVARSASLPMTLPATSVSDDDLIVKIRGRFLSSKLADKAQRDYEAVGMTGSWWKSADKTITSQVFRHPKTGEVIVSMQAVLDHGCGGADINIWGLYQVDESGAVRQRQLIDASSMLHIGTAIDIDGDGTFEFHALDSNADPALISFEGEVLRILEAPFYGCNC